MGRWFHRLLNVGCRWLRKGEPDMNNMNDQNRVLLYCGARDITAEEADRITGGLQAGTICTITFHPRSKDGDCA
jgi:hypothetical protein